jgi:hypothetical protein
VWKPRTSPPAVVAPASNLVPLPSDDVTLPRSGIHQRGRTLRAGLYGASGDVDGACASDVDGT